MAANGLRVSEITRAQATDLEPEAGGGHSLMITGKGGKRYRVPLNASTERVVVTHLGGRRHGFLFRRRDGRRRDGNAPLIPYTQQAIWRLFARDRGRVTWLPADGAFAVLVDELTEPVAVAINIRPADVARVRAAVTDPGEEHDEVRRVAFACAR